MKNYLIKLVLEDLDGNEHYEHHVVYARDIYDAKIIGKNLADYFRSIRYEYSYKYRNVNYSVIDEIEI